MIPLVINLAELDLTRHWVEEEVAAVLAEHDARLDVKIGTMIETPRAAIRADEIAEAADFFSFGTNDLTQMTFGFSRDDVAPILDKYLSMGLLSVDPFESIDQPGVGELVRMAPSGAGPPSPGSSSACAASTAVTRRRSPSSSRSASTTCRAHRSGCRWPGWRPPTPCSARAATAPTSRPAQHPTAHSKVSRSGRTRSWSAPTARRWPPRPARSGPRWCRRRWRPGSAGC